MWFQKRAETLAAPFVVATTGEFDGCDGEWSTFSLEIGASETQEFRVLVSSLGGTSWLPKANGSCPSRGGPSDCPDLRGIDVFNGGISTGYQSGVSSSYEQVGLYGLSFSGDLSMSKAFGSSSTYVNISGEYGLDRISLKSSISSNGTLSSNSTPFAAINDLSFFLGSLGLGWGSIEPASTTYPTFMESLANANEIPSRSWGYTAGASYRDSGYLGNLVLGGYDQSRFEPTDVSFSMPPSSGQTLLEVTVQGLQVNFDDGSSYSFTSDAGQSTNSFDAVLDSTLPYLYLPSSVCDEMERRLRLVRTEDDLGNEIYLFNETASGAAPERLQITVTDTTRSSESTTISLPFDALNLTASWPLFTNGSRPYFPIRRNQGEASNILGRVFFQEAYVIADYERHNFTIARATFPNPPPGPQIVSIYNTSFAAPPSQSSSEEGGGGSSGLSGGAIAGIVIGVLAVLFGIAAWFWLVWRKKRRVARERKEAEAADEKAREEENARQGALQGWRETVSTMSSTGFSHEMDAGSRIERPRASRQLSELSSDSEVDHRGNKQMRTPSAIYELPDSEAWHWNAQRMNQRSPSIQQSDAQSETARGSPGPSRPLSTDYFTPPPNTIFAQDEISRGPSPGLQPPSARHSVADVSLGLPSSPAFYTPGYQPSPILSPQTPQEPQDKEVEADDLYRPPSSHNRPAAEPVSPEPVSAQPVSSIEPNSAEPDSAAPSSAEPVSEPMSSRLSGATF